MFMRTFFPDGYTTRRRYLEMEGDSYRHHSGDPLE